MIGGFTKSTSTLALTLAAGLAMSTSAFAADLGGNCCADLEERVAELEATVVKKGNRKMGVTLWGTVNRMILAWDAPALAGQPSSGTYYGIDNTNFATRFGIRGDAKIDADRKAGYSITIDVASAARSATVTRIDEDGGATSGNDHNLRMRDANVWLESARLGRLTLGRLTNTGAITTIDLGGVGTVASAGYSLNGGSITFGNGRTINAATDQAADYGYRIDGVRWNSPTWNGFEVGLAYGETARGNTTGLAGPQVDGNVWGANLRYAGEFNGVRLAAGIGYERAQDDVSTTPNVNAVNFGGSLALMHTATGLFLQGDIMQFERTPAGAAAIEGDRWLLQGGLSRDFFGIGKTVLYAEVARHNNDANLFFVGAGALSTKSWGLGVVQNIDAAAMEIYAGYRKHSLTEAAIDRGDIGLFTLGARINF